MLKKPASGVLSRSASSRTGVRSGGLTPSGLAGGTFWASCFSLCHNPFFRKSCDPKFVCGLWSSSAPAWVRV